MDRNIAIANLKGSERAIEVALMIQKMPPFKQGVALGVLSMLQSGVNPPKENFREKPEKLKAASV